MDNQVERRAYRLGPGSEVAAAIHGRKLSMDFAKIVKTIDLGKDDETIAEMGMKQLKDDQKIKEFYAKK